MPDKTVPSAFISYAWEGAAYREWVRQLAIRLRGDGVDAILDQWEAVPGDQLPRFMETQVRESDFVLILCTPKYKQKSEARTGGVGYEGDVMTGEVFTGASRRKFIPLLCRGSWLEAAPGWLSGTYYIDLSSDPLDPHSYDDLLTTLHGVRELAPPVGPPPKKRAKPVTLRVGAPESAATVAGTGQSHRPESLSTDGSEQPSRIRIGRSTALIAAVGGLGLLATLGLVFSAPLLAICQGFDWCRTTDPAVQAVSRIAFGESRVHLEQAHLLGPPKFKDEDLLPDLVLDVDGSDEVLDAVKSGKFESATAYVNSKYAFATYARGSLNYTVRYTKDKGRLDAVLFEPSDDQTKCADLTKFRLLTGVVESSRALCLGAATFGQFFPRDGASPKYPMALKEYPATCWGGMSIGGASGHGSFVEITCDWRRQVNTAPALGYLIVVRLSGVEVAEENYTFSERDGAKEGSFEEFLKKASHYKVGTVALYQ